jgi:hypothetical protein
MHLRFAVKLAGFALCLHVSSSLLKPVSVKGICPEVGNLAKIFDWVSQPSVFQPCPTRALTAHRDQLAPTARVILRGSQGQEIGNKALPTFSERAPSEVKGLKPDHFTGAHLPEGIDVKCGNTSPADEEVIGFKRPYGSDAEVLPFLGPFFISPIQCQDILRGKPVAAGHFGAVQPGIEQGIETEPDPQPFSVFLYFRQLVTIQRRHHGLQGQGDMTFHEQFNPFFALSKGAGDTRYFFIGGLCGTIEGNFYGKRRPLSQIIGNLRREECAIGEKGDDEALLLGIGVDIQKVLPEKGFSTGDEKPKAPGLCHLVENSEGFLCLELFFEGIDITDRQVTIAVDATKVAAKGQFDGTRKRHPRGFDARVKALGELSVAHFGDKGTRHVIILR